MRLRIKIISILSFLACLQSLQAQEYQMKDLLSKQWKLGDEGCYCDFSEAVWTTWLLLRNGETSKFLEMPYYLSVTKDTVFDDQKVGKQKKGKYIIAYEELTREGKKIPDVVAYEIKELTETSLVLVNGTNELALYNLPIDKIRLLRAQKKCNVASLKQNIPKKNQSVSPNSEEVERELLKKYRGN